MINSTFQVTFGIEVECVLAFHENLLRNHLAATETKTKIKKDIPEDIRRELKQGSHHYHDDASRQIHMGWALTAPTAYPAERDNNGYQEHFDLQLSKFGYRAYGGEILHVAQAVLPSGVKVYDSFSENRYTDFSHWHLTHEQGLVGIDREDLQQRLEKLRKDWLPAELANTIELWSRAKEWDTHPLELVSRVLPYNSASITEIDRHLIALNGGPTHFAFATKHCGLHVHIGLPVPANHPAGTPPPTFTLPTLQHIAYIQVMYQTQISKLHPPSRGDGTNIDLKSNLDNFYDEPEPLTDAEYDVLDARGKYSISLAPLSRFRANDEADTVILFLVLAGEDPDVVYAVQAPTFSFSKARAKIFAPDMTIQKLSELMGGNDKWRIVNWKYVARMNGQARTLEFRQHKGTLCTSAIKRWIDFVVGLVRLAEHNSRKYGSGADYDGSGYKHKELSEESSVWDLMERMELGKVEMKWWKMVIAEGL